LVNGFNLPVHDHELVRGKTAGQAASAFQKNVNNRSYGFLQRGEWSNDARFGVTESNTYMG
jgi:hypothetical protein